MPSWGALVWGAAASAVVAVAVVALLQRERRALVLAAAAGSAAAGPFLWNVILRHTGGDFFVDAPIAVFPISLQDTGSGVFATALAGVVLGLGPLGRSTGRRVAGSALLCGLAALLVDIYLY